MKRQIWAILFSLCVCGAVSAQSYPRNVNVDPYGRNRSPEEANTVRRDVDLQGGSYQVLQMQRLNSRSFGGDSSDKTSMRLMKEAKKYVVPRIEFQNKYAAFLKQPNTGIVRLLSRIACADNDGSGNKEKFSDLLKRCSANFIQGNGKYFSFRKKEYVNSDFADIGFTDNWFFSLGIMNQGILVGLGDVDIQSLSINSNGIDYLAKFVPSPDMEGLTKEFGQFEKVIKIKDLSYGKAISIEKNINYALRVVAYNSYFLVENSGKKDKTTKFFPMKSDEREDVIVVFRVAEKNEDGSLIILWKELQRTQSPEMNLSN